MSQAVLPFLEYLFLQAFVCIIGLSTIHERELGASGLMKSWIFGQMLLFAVLQVIAVPMILMRCKFNLLFWSYCGVFILLLGFGLWNLLKKKKIKITIRNLSSVSLVLMMMVILLILWHAGTYIFGIHLDEDDARWLVEANDALEYGDLMNRNYYTGEYASRFLNVEDVTSPWPILFAIISRLLSTRVSIVAHTLYPAVEVFIIYGIYWMIAKELFENKEAQLTFLLLCEIVTLFFGGSVYTQGIFVLNRLWQGKASVAGVAIPFILYLFICINKKNEGFEWLFVAIAGAAASLMSGMGIIISSIMIGVYGLYNILAYQHWKRILPWLCSLMPSLSVLFVNLYLRR